MQVRARYGGDGAHSGPWSGEARATVAAEGSGSGAGNPPAAPTGLLTAATHDSVLLAWDNPVDDGVTGYRVLRRVRTEGNELKVIAPDTGSAATSYTDETVAAETAYEYQVKAINARGVSEASASANANTPAAPVLRQDDPPVADRQIDAPVLLLSNLGQRTHEVTILNVGATAALGIAVGTKEFAQEFTTGSAAAGNFQLSGIDLDVLRVPNTPSDVTVALWSATDDATATPDVRIATLTHSIGRWATGVNTFNAPAGTSLEADATYFVFVSYGGGDPILRINTTLSSSADETSAPGWSVGWSAQRARGSQVAWTVINGLAVKFRVNAPPGSIVPVPVPLTVPGRYLGVLHLPELRVNPNNHRVGNRQSTALTGRGSTLWVGDALANLRIDQEFVSADGTIILADVDPLAAFNIDFASHDFGRYSLADSFWQNEDCIVTCHFPTAAWYDGNDTIYVVEDQNALKELSYLARGSVANPRTHLAMNREVTASGVWSDGSTVWISDRGRTKRILAHDLATGARRPAKDFGPGLMEGAPYGLWSDGDRLWVATLRDDNTSKILAYDLASKQRVPGADIRLTHRYANDIWADPGSGIMWVADDHAQVHAYCYDAAKDCHTNRELYPFEAWSEHLRRDEYQDASLGASGNDLAVQLTGHENSDDGSVDLYTFDSEDVKVYKHSYMPGGRKATTDKSVTSTSFALASENQASFGIWTDGTTVYVVDSDDSTVYAYTAAGARDSGKDFGLPSARSYARMWSDGTDAYFIDIGPTLQTGEDDRIVKVAGAFTSTADPRAVAVVADLERDRFQDLWSDGTTLWALDRESVARAYTLAGTRDPAKDIGTADIPDTLPIGLWSNGRIFWFLHETSTTARDTVHGYRPNVSLITP